MKAKRPICANCLRPQSACMCRWITPVTPEAQVLVLQHPLEVDHPKNSARLLHLSLSGSRMMTGECFDAASLHAALDISKYTILLYPQTAHTQREAAPELDPVRLKDPANLRLVVLDGTWRKSRKMLYLSPLLQRLPRWSLDDVPASRYTVRKAHKPGQLSTLEATCAALAQLEGDPQKYQPLLNAFDGFVTQQSDFFRAL